MNRSSRLYDDAFHLGVWSPDRTLLINPRSHPLPRNSAEDRNEERQAYLQRCLKERDKEVDRLCANLEELDKEENAVGGSLQTIESGSVFPIGPSVVASSAGLGANDLDRSRPLRLSRNPGVAALCGASIGLLVHLLELGTSVAKQRLDWGAFYFRVERGLYAVENSVRLLLSERCVRAPAIGVLVAFGLHALGGRRWIASGWINWAGLAVGACWVSLLLMLWCL